MPVTRTSFLIRYPEFSNAATALIDEHIAAAIAALDTEAFGARLDDAVMLKAAQSLALRHEGMDLRLEQDSEKTIYDKQLDDICYAAGASWRMVLGE